LAATQGERRHHRGALRRYLRSQIEENLLQSLSASNLSPSDAAALVKAINHWASISAIWVLVIGAIVAAFDVRRILRVGPPA
jgi:hypothetical protein